MSRPAVFISTNLLIITLGWGLLSWLSGYQTEALKADLTAVHPATAVTTPHPRPAVHRQTEWQLAQALKTRVPRLTFENTDNLSNKTTEHYAALTEKVLASLPTFHTASLQNLTIKGDSDGVRGLAGRQSIMVRFGNLPEEEYVSLLIHELGHLTDLGGLTAPDRRAPSTFKDGHEIIWDSDPSVNYYLLSWVDSQTRLSDSTEKDFCSQYGQTDPFEDFAECYNLYYLNGATFANMAATSPVLQAKYDFIKDTIFTGQEFRTNPAVLSANTRVWDVTQLAYNTHRFDTD